MLARQRNSKILVINGADDYFVPQTGRVAMSEAPEVVAQVVAWLRARLTTER